MATIQQVRLQSIGGYQPNGETKATVTGIFWDREHKRVALSILYDNGATDWIPAREVEELVLGVNRTGFPYRVSNK